MHKDSEISAEQALERLKTGNKAYLTAHMNSQDISPELRAKTYFEGQHPYAVIVTCSDSRVIPESIFMAGIGELFVVRVAGNVMDNLQFGSVEYAVSHLGCKLIIVLGHTCCGAVSAAVHQCREGYIRYIADEIRLAVKDETDLDKACRLNVQRSVRRIEECLGACCLKQEGVRILGAVYRIESGEVEYL